ncbi:TPA: peptidase T [Streptococcus pneumoniae]
MTYPNLLDRFLTYVKVNTRSDEHSTTTPSTQSQVDFATNVLIPEMKRVGLQNVYYLPNGFAIGTLPANDPSLTRKIGFISHMDTADFNAEGVNPQVIENYDGGVIELGNSGFKLDPADFKSLEKYPGQTLITTDGTSLLGADDKSGIAEIMTTIEYLTAHPEIKHCEIRVGFGPDEEIGVGANKFDAEDFDVDFAYTVDGGPLGELQYETFSAAGAELHFQGRNVHPGTAKGQMVNALQLAIDFHNQLPENDRPELNEELGSDRVTLNLTDQYYNMKEVIEKDMTPITIAKAVMEDLGITPIIEPIRGGTDGSKISFMGIPTPNIFAGGENMHGRFEYVSLQTMERAVDTIIGIVAYKG